MIRYLVAFSCVFMLASSAVAQTKFSGTLECGKADPTYTIQIPDREGYSFEIGQNKCTWTKPFAIAGLESKNNVQAESDEVTGNTIKAIAYGFTQFSNGDKAFHRGVSTADQKAQTSSGKWTFTAGTGKLRGIKGSGTSTCKIRSAESGGGYACEIEGEYTLPAAKKQ
jgi:hypothetical protein